MEGQMCWCLVQSQGDPCKGCNANRAICNGRFAPYEDKTYGLMCFLGRMDEADRKYNEERRKRLDEIIERRKEGHLEGYTRTILEVSSEHDRKLYIQVVVKDLVNEKAYETRCDTIEDSVSIIQYCCCKYDVEQIHVDADGYGMELYNRITKVIKNIDIVPLRYAKLKLT